VKIFTLFCGTIMYVPNRHLIYLEEKMRRLLLIITAITFFAIYGISFAQTQTDSTKMKPQHGKNFVDNNGDGYNDNAPDEDGDGIPNGLDPDFTGPKKQNGKRAFVDLNGDGIDDNTGMARAKRGKGGFGPHSGNQSMGQKNGSGIDANAEGTGNQGNKGRGKRMGRK